MSHFSQPKMSRVVKNGFYADNIRYRVVQSDNTLVVRSVRLEHETHAKYETCSCVTSIVEERGCFQTELRIAGNSNKLIYFRKATSRIYSTKLLQI